jgi:hypothetical protein
MSKSSDFMLGIKACERIVKELGNNVASININCIMFLENDNLLSDDWVQGYNAGLKHYDSLVRKNIKF